MLGDETLTSAGLDYKPQDQHRQKSDLGTPSGRKQHPQLLAGMPLEMAVEIGLAKMSFNVLLS